MKGFTVKQFRIVPAAALVAAGLLCASAMAQEPRPARPDHELLRTPPPERGPAIPDLSDQQKEQIRKLRLALSEKTLPLRNQLGEKEAHLMTLVSAKDPDAAAVEKAAEEIGDLRAQIFKARVLGDLKIRALLTEEQKASLDALPGPPGPMDGQLPPPGR